jgi:hypothetical protein
MAKLELVIGGKVVAERVLPAVERDKGLSVSENRSKNKKLLQIEIEQLKQDNKEAVNAAGSEYQIRFATGTVQGGIS